MNINIHMLHYLAYAVCLYYMIQAITKQNRTNKNFSDIFSVLVNMDKKSFESQFGINELLAIESSIQRSKKLDSYMIYYCNFMFLMGVFNIYASEDYMGFSNISYLLITILFMSGVFTLMHTSRSKAILQNFEEILNDLKIERENQKSVG